MTEETAWQMNSEIIVVIITNMSLYSTLPLF